MKRLALLNKETVDFQYNSRDLVYIISPLTRIDTVLIPKAQK